MLPYIKTEFGDISTFSILIVIATLVMLFAVKLSLKNAVNQASEVVFIYPKIVVCGISGFFVAGIFDSIFKFIEYGTFQISGITFYGGLIGAILALYIQLKIMGNRGTQYSIEEWFDLLTLPFILFHCIGRIGCFFAGCCYGKPTDSFLGVVFPDNLRDGIVHNGVSCYPTQLFESVALLGIFVFVLFRKHKFQVYLLCYAIVRFFLEFIRGDDRGYILIFLSPAQLISCIVVLLQILRSIAHMKKRAITMQK